MTSLSRLRSLLLILLLLALLPATAWAGNTTGQELDQEWFAGLFKEIISQHAPWPAEDLQISNVTSRPRTLGGCPSEISLRLLAAPQSLRLGRQYLTVQLRCADNPLGEVQISGDVGLSGTVVLAGRQLKRNTVLKESDLITVRRDITMLGAEALRNPEQATGKRLTTSLQAGAILYANLLDAPPLVKRGDRVTIVARSEVVEITTPGLAKMAGAKGELIRVKNLASRRELYAKVLDGSTVAVEF